MHGEQKKGKKLAAFMAGVMLIPVFGTIRMDREDAQKIPILALRANAFHEDVQRGMQAGRNAQLSKPVEPEILFETLESLIGN